MIEFQDFNIRDYNSYSISCVFRKVYFPQCNEDFLTLFKKGLLKYDRIVGRGNNILFSKKYYDDSLIIIHDNFSDVVCVDDTMFALAGTDMKTMSIIANNRGLTGLEYFYDIPSSFGGALFMNAGSNDVEIHDMVTEVNVLDLNDGKIKRLTKAKYKFGYRYTSFREQNYIILSGRIKMNQIEPSVGFEKMIAIRTLRHSKQPRNFPSAGSVFKRPNGHFVGPMIENLNLKGYSIGGARVSEKHAGFIINSGEAEGEDIVKLIQYIQERVKQEYNVNLEIEQIII